MQKNKKRVLLVSPLVSNVMGGISKWTNNIYDYYKTLDSPEVELVPCYNPNIQSTLSDEGFIGRVRKGISNYLPLIKKVRKILKSEHIDVVHICTSASIGLIKDIAIISIAKKYHVKAIVHFHFGRIPIIFKRNNWEQRLIRKVVSLSDRVVVMDGSSYSVLLEQGYKNVCNIPNPLSVDTEKSIESLGSIARVPNKVVFVGQMLQTKGIYELAEACAAITNVEVHYIGPMPDAAVADKLRTIIEQPKLCIHGPMPFHDVIKEMMSASVFVLPTYSEGFPNVIIESMACCCPIVTTPVGAIPEMLDIKGMHKCGLCVPVKDVEKLREAISYMLENGHEASLMGNNAKHRVFEKYSICKVWKLLNDSWIRVSTQIRA